MKSGGDMNVDEVWDATDRERIAIADLLDELADDEWEHPSLCDGWRVRDVAAHLSMAQTGVAEAAVALVRARFGFNRMIHDTAVRRSGRPREEFTAALRGMAGSRKRAPGISHIEPLTDVLVHTQDIVVPLGRSYAMPPRAAAFCAERVWTMGFPFHARRRFATYGWSRRTPTGPPDRDASSSVRSTRSCSRSPDARPAAPGSGRPILRRCRSAGCAGRTPRSPPTGCAGRRPARSHR